MPKDNENIRLPLLGPIEPSEPQGFTPDQMVRCEECLRANPPTRINCLYCSAPLPVTEASSRLRKPILRRPEKHQLGYNTILLPNGQTFSTEIINEAATLLKLNQQDLQRILAKNVALPLARTASPEEAKLVSDRLLTFGFRIVTLTDEDLGIRGIKRVKSMSFDETRLTMNPRGNDELKIEWSKIVLLVPGRLIVKRVEVKELKSRRPETEMLDSSEFFNDELVLDLYTATHPATWRVNAKSFDFSCLESQKTLIASENSGRLQRLLEAKATNARVDDSYNRLRAVLDLVWGVEQEIQSSGWRRERPGKLSIGMATIHSNESQFRRYSRLLYYFTLNN